MWFLRITASKSDENITKISAQYCLLSYVPDLSTVGQMAAHASVNIHIISGFSLSYTFAF